MTKFRILSILSIVASLLARSGSAPAQDQVLPDAPSVAAAAALPPARPLYTRPTQDAMFKSYALDAFGPLPLIGAGLVAGIGQWSNSPPEWHQGAEGYGKRLGSDFGMAATATTTRFALSEALKEDTLYYPCECSGILPRLRHAVISSVTARRGQDGHRVFSMSAIVAPYAGSTVGVYGWYPDRYGAKDALRIGNYSFLGRIGGNVALEFLYGGPYSLLSRLRRKSAHSSPDPGLNQ